MDARWPAAVAASVRWYDDVFAVHRIPTSRSGGIWQALAEPPRWHSAVKTLEPRVPVGDVLAAMDRHPHGSVADSFGDLDLGDEGFELLFEATWLHRRVDPGPTARLPPGWAVVADAAELAAWNQAHDTVGVLLPDLLTHPAFTVLARRSGGELTGGAVLHDTPGAVGLSNGWSRPGHEPGWPDLVVAGAALHPGRDLVDYAAGADLEAALAAGFAPLGPQRVWVR